jgi:hypothetical protein
MGAVESLGAILEIPPTALRHEWDDARNQYAMFNDQFPQSVKDLYEVYLQKMGVDVRDAKAMLKATPELQQYLAAKEEAIYASPVLSEYYGGIDFLEGSWRRRMYADAEQLFGAGIFDTQWGFYELDKRGGDTETYLAVHPELQEYWIWLPRAKANLGAQLAAIAPLIPETPQAIVRPDAIADSVASADVMQAMYEQQNSTPMSQLEALIEPYMVSAEDMNRTISTQAWVNIEGEKRWPGVVALNQEFESLSRTNPLAAQSFLGIEPTLQAFRQFEREVRDNINRTTGGKELRNPTAVAKEMSWQDWEQALNPDGTKPYVPALTVDYFRGRDLSPDLVKYLKGLWRSMGSPMGSFTGWLAAMKESWDGSY